MEQAIEILFPLVEKYLSNNGFISEESKERLEDLLADKSPEKQFFAIASVLEDAVNEALGD